MHDNHNNSNHLIIHIPIPAQVSTSSCRKQTPLCSADFTFYSTIKPSCNLEPFVAKSSVEWPPESNDLGPTVDRWVFTDLPHSDSFFFITMKNCYKRIRVVRFVRPGPPLEGLGDEMQTGHRTRQKNDPQKWVRKNVLLSNSAASCGVCCMWRMAPCIGWDSGIL